MHLVFATSLVPDGALSTGYEIANRAILDALARAGVRVTVMGFARPGSVPADLEHKVVLDRIEVTTDEVSLARKAHWLANAIRFGLPVASAKLRVVAPDAVAAALSRLMPFDAVMLNAAQISGAFESIFQRHQTLFIAHNVEHQSAEAVARHAASPFERLLYRREARLLRALEQRLCRQARFVFTLAEEDRRLLGLAEERSASLPLVTRQIPPSATCEREIDCEAALIGTWTWAPNRVGLQWFLEEVVPRLPSGFRIRIAGRIPSGIPKGPPNVEFVGRVPDAAAFLGRAAVVPLVSRAGTGVQIKSIETFELGLPAVATRSALRGIAQIPVNCIVADEPAGFAGALVRQVEQRAPRLDGARFFRVQQSGLDEALRRGLASLAAERRAAA
jgi:hypothetical protein